MSNITEDYISFETASVLKEKGFDEYCTFYYKKDEETELFNKATSFKNSELHEKYVCAPSQSLVLKWLRVKHNKFISIKKDWENNKMLGYEAIIDDEDGFVDMGTFKTPEEATEVAIIYSLKNLVK